MPANRLTDAQITEALSRLPEWRFESGALHRSYRFPDFVRAFSFMTACALRIQEMDHHPEWSNVYGSVEVRLVTHDAGGVTQRDVDLAGRMEALAT